MVLLKRSVVIALSGVLAVLLIMVSAGPSAAIIDGYPVENGDVPWMASVASEKTPEQAKQGFKYNHDCGGAIIGESWVITAAHCIGEDEVWVEVGRVDLDQPALRHEVEEVILHPEEATIDDLGVDLALLKLVKPLPLESGKVEAIALDPDPVSPRTEAFTAGWGKTETVYPQNPNLTVKKTLTRRKKCEPAATRVGVSIDEVICTLAKDGKGDIASGDSGGPLYLRPTPDRDASLIGVLSGGFYDIETQTDFSNFTPIASHIEWIESEMKK